jgi:hypothetical protein
MDRIDIGDGELVGKERLARQGERLGGEGPVAIGVGERPAHRRDEVRVKRRHGAAPIRGRTVEQDAGRRLLAGLPAGERLGFVDRQKFQPVERHARQFDRRREAAQQ